MNRRKVKAIVQVVLSLVMKQQVTAYSERNKRDLSFKVNKGKYFRSGFPSFLYYKTVHLNSATFASF